MVAWLAVFAGCCLLWAVADAGPQHPNILMTIQPSGLVVKQPLEDLNLTCLLNSTQDLKYRLEWKVPLMKDPQLLASRTSIINHTNLLTLNIRQLREGDSGHYLCEVTDSQGLSIMRSVRLNVKSGRHRDRCPEQSFVCSVKNHCISRRYVCDGFNDCIDGEDEAYNLCGKNPCEDKVHCVDGRCIPKAMCCDRDEDPNCSVMYIHPCCVHYLNERKPSRPGSKYGTDLGFLQSTVYTIVSCSVAFLIIGTLLVVAICRFQLRRSIAAITPPPPARASRRLRRQYTPSFTVTYRDSNGVQVLEHLPKPPPYSETLLTDPPPPYSSRESLAPAEDPLLPPPQF